MTKRRFDLPHLRGRTLLALSVWAWVGGCAMETVQPRNVQPAQRLAQQPSAPVGSAYAGWRVYQQRCASCHGADAGGGDGVPDLRLQLRDIGAQRFVDLVLRRYDWGLAAGSPGSPRETLVDEVIARERGGVEMPAWHGEPTVSAHIMDLYVYLSARADGRLGPEPPAR